MIVFGGAWASGTEDSTDTMTNVVTTMARLIENFEDFCNSGTVEGTNGIHLLSRLGLVLAVRGDGFKLG